MGALLARGGGHCADIEPKLFSMITLLPTIQREKATISGSQVIALPLYFAEHLRHYVMQRENWHSNY